MSKLIMLLSRDKSVMETQLVTQITTEVRKVFLIKWPSYQVTKLMNVSRLHFLQVQPNCSSLTAEILQDSSVFTFNLFVND